MTSYTNIFTGRPVYPSNTGFRELDLTIDMTLVWPTTLTDDPDRVEPVMKITTTVNGSTMIMPSAIEASENGEITRLINDGTDDVIVRDADLNQILLIQPGEEFQIILEDNSTIAGVWKVIAMGATATQAQAAVLAGHGLRASGLQLETDFDVIEPPNFPLTIDATYRAQLIEWTGGTHTITLPPYDGVDIDDGFYFAINTSGAFGEVTLQPPPGVLIDGAVNLDLSPGKSTTVIFNGQDWLTLGLGEGNFFTVGVNDLNVAPADVTLTAQQASRLVQQYTGVLTADRIVTVPNVSAQYYVFNNTTGPFNLTFTNGSQSYILPQGQRLIFYSDGANLLPIPTTFLPANYRFENGTAADPSLDFKGDPTTGIYSVASSGTVSFASGGANVADIGAEGFNTQTKTYKRADVSIFSLVKLYA